MKRASMLVAAFATAGLTGSASAQFFAVVPEANANVRGPSGLNTLTRDAGQARTYLQQYPEAQLLAQGLTPGMVITGITWRASVTPSNTPLWPPAGGATWDDYEITLAEAANPIGAMSTTFADNMTNPVMVQSGRLHIPESTFSNTNPPAPEPNTWGFEITFPSYTYQGGDLVVHYSHTGSDLSGSFSFLDGVGSSDLSGRAMSASAFQAPIGGSATATFTITRFTFIPTPGTLAMLGLGGLVALRRRR